MTSETLLQFAVTSGLLGLFWLAYFHPEEIRPAIYLAAGLSFLSAAMMLCWNTALDNAEEAAIRLVQVSDHDRLQAAMEALTFPLWLIVVLGAIYPIPTTLILLNLGTLKKRD